MLVDLYTRLRTDATPVYARDSRVEGHLIEYEEAVRRDDAVTTKVASDKLREFEITDRLRRDVVDVLSAVGSKEAKKAFIDYVRDYPAFFGSSGQPIMGEMETLIRMGSNAVPDIIEALSAARSDPEPLSSIGFQKRLVRMLGLIGDPKALPALDELANDEDLRGVVESAVRSIVGGVVRR
jgi:HEAT repeat protein